MILIQSKNLLKTHFYLVLIKWVLFRILEKITTVTKNLSLDEAVRKTIKTKTKYNPKGPIRILTHLRYFGYCFNPVSFFYCYNKEDTEVEMIMAEVTNTPWNERHCYFIDNKKIINSNRI